MKIEIDLPFSWCDKCTAIELETEKFHFDKEAYSTHYCKNMGICTSCENARKAEGGGEDG